MAALGVVAGGLAFGVWGGEYSTADWLTLRRQVREEGAGLESLARENDSLRAAAEALETDRWTQERVAREKFGMLRPGELLYRVEPVEEYRR